MSIITNGNLGPVYQPDYFEARQVLAADSALTTTPTVESNFSFNVLKGERVAYRFTLFYDQDNAGDDLQFTISSVDAAGSAVVPAFYSQHIIAVVPGSVGFFGVSTTPNTEATLTTAGTGQAIAIIQGVINGNAATNSTVRLLLAKQADTAGATTVQEGSFLELRRF